MMPLFMEQQNDRQLGQQWYNMSTITLSGVVPIVIAGLLLERSSIAGLTFGAVTGLSVLHVPGRCSALMWELSHCSSTPSAAFA